VALILKNIKCKEYRKCTFSINDNTIVKTPVLRRSRKNESIKEGKIGGKSQAMKKKETQLHDKNFRRRIRILWLLRAFLKTTLPKSTLKLLNLYKLQILDSQLVTPHSHRNLNTDFVCRIGLKGDDAFALILIEHQSKADKMMPLRILRYAG